MGWQERLAVLASSYPLSKVNIGSKWRWSLTFAVHNLLSKGIDSDPEHLLNTPEKDDVIAINLQTKRTSDGRNVKQYIK